MSESDEDAGPALPHKEAARHIGRTARALYALNDRRKGPPSFMSEGRRMYRLKKLDAWLRAQEAKDSRSNPELNPVLKTPEARRARRPQAIAA